MIKIYANKHSGNSRKVLYAAELLGLEYEYVEMQFNEEIKSEEHLKRHPAGKLPAIDDDGFVLFESNTIIKYFASKKGSDLNPTGLKEQALMSQWLDFSQLHVGLAMGKVGFNRVVAPMLNLPVDENSLKEGLEWLDRYLPIIDKQLEGKEHIVGSLSVADIVLFTIIEDGIKSKIDYSKYANITKYMQTMSNKDFVKKFA